MVVWVPWHTPVSQHSETEAGESLFEVSLVYSSRPSQGWSKALSHKKSRRLQQHKHFSNICSKLRLHSADEKTETNGAQNVLLNPTNLKTPLHHSFQSVSGNAYQVGTLAKERMPAKPHMCIHCNRDTQLWQCDKE